MTVQSKEEERFLKIWLQEEKLGFQLMSANLVLAFIAVHPAKIFGWACSKRKWHPTDGTAPLGRIHPIGRNHDFFFLTNNAISKSFRSLKVLEVHQIDSSKPGEGSKTNFNQEVDSGLPQVETVR